MAGILDNKNIAELVIKGDTEGTYIKINPETLAKVVEDETTQSSGKPEDVDANVQQHMDDKTIHLNKTDIQSLIKNKIETSDIKSGSKNVTIKTDNDTNTVWISATDYDDLGYLTADDIESLDSTITIAKGETSNKAYIRANIPDVSRMIKQRNIKSLGTGITVKYDDDSNDVYIFGEGEQFTGGNGIEIKDYEIINTMPDREVILNEGDNIEIDGTYPNFTIRARGEATILDWEPQINYDIDKLVIFENSLMRCIEKHTSSEVFDSEKWELISGWSSKRQYFNITTAGTTDILLNDTIPNKDVLIINIGGVHQQAQNYDLQPDKQTVRFINPLPVGEIVEVMVMSNVVMDTYDSGVNVMPWEKHTAYGVNNIVLYDDNIYVCINKHESSESFEKSNWKLICGYLKKTYTMTPQQDLTSYNLPLYLPSKEMVSINVNGRLLMSSEYTAGGSNTITFTPAISAGSTIDISVYNAGTLQLPEIPSVDGKVRYFITTNDAGEQYILRSTDEILEILNLETLLNFASHPDSIITVNDLGTGYEYVSYNALSSEVKGGQTVEGLELSYDEFVESDNKHVSLIMGPGSIMGKNNKGQTVLLTLKQTLSKDVSTAWEKGSTSSGSAIGTDLDDWESPIFKNGATQDNYQISTYPADTQTDRQGWRAMDGLLDGNSWQVTGSTARFSLETPKTQDLIITGFEFWNLNSGTNANYSEKINVWSQEQTNVLASFTANPGDYAYTRVDFENDTPARLVGFNILSATGDGSTCGAAEVRFIGKTRKYLAKNHIYYVYLLGNVNGVADEFATSVYEEDEFIKNYIPEGYEYACLVGTYETDYKYDLINIFPSKRLNTMFIDGSIGGKISGNSIETRVYDTSSNRPVLLLEQFGETVPSYGRIDFPQEFKQLLYVIADGVKITTKDNAGFTVPTTVEKVSWVAKGYK